MKTVIYYSRNGYKHYLHTFHNGQVVTAMDKNKGIQFEDELNARMFISENKLNQFYTEQLNSLPAKG